jgi:hypothetical protein
VVAAFDPAYGQLPEGLAIRDGAAYVGFAVLGTIDAVDLGSGAISAYAATPPLPQDLAFVTGLTFDEAGALYAAVASFSPDLPGGIYRTPADGGDAAAYGTGGMVFASDAELDEAGTAYVTDSTLGAVYRIAPDGTTEPWLVDPILAGGMAICGNDQGLFDIGANGLVYTPDALYVAVTDQGTVVEVPIAPDGSPGTPSVFAGPDCDALGGIDGLTLDPTDGSLYGAVNRHDRVVRIDPAGAVTTLIDDPILDFPASIRWTELDGRRALLVTNFALNNALSGAEAHPSLVRYWLE